MFRASNFTHCVRQANEDLRGDMDEEQKQRKAGNARGALLREAHMTAGIFTTACSDGTARLATAASGALARRVYLRVSSAFSSPPLLRTASHRLLSTPVR